MVHKHFSKGDVIWSEGDDSTFFGIIVSGAVKLVKSIEDGRQQIVGLCLSSDCFGNPINKKRKTSAVALTNTEICSFPQTAFERSLEEDQKLEHALLETSYRDIEDMQNLLTALGQMSATERVANFLYWILMRSIRSKCSTPNNDKAELTFSIPLTRSDIADYLGLSIETVSRNFSKLSRAGCIKLIDSRTINVSDIRKLKRLANASENAP